jgi:OOP family OmpA-OmpF porin
MNIPMKLISRFLIAVAVSVCWIPAHSQLLKSKKPVQKNALQLGDQYFAAGEYYTAANLYGQFLNPKKEMEKSDFPLNVKSRRTTAGNISVSRTDILFKQAEAYRLANYWQEAADLYKACAEKDPAKYGSALYWQAICERSLGHYDSAKEILEQYLNINDESAQYYQDARKELQTLNFIRQQLARADSVLFKTQKIEIPNSHEKGAFAPVRVSDNQFLISSTQPDSVQVNGVNPYHARLFYATLNNGNLENLTPVAIPSAGPITNQGAGTVSADGEYLYFSQWKKEKGQTVSSIYYSTKQDNGWSAPALVPSINTDGANSKQPFCSPDGKYLYFASDRPGGSGGFDIWYAPLKDDGTTGEPVNAGAVINTKNDEQAPFYQNSSNTLVFSSNGREGMGGYDLFSAKGSELTWKDPENLGYPVNSQKDDIYFFAPEQEPLLSNAIVSSDRGSGCCLESYNITKAPKNKRLTGIINDCQDNQPAAYAKVVLKDVSGKNWTTTTDDNGNFIFEIGSGTYRELSLTISKDQYLESASLFRPEKTDETDLLTDNLVNVTICIEKIPEEKPKEPEPLVIKAEDVVTVFFEFDRSLLKDEAISKLDSIYSMLVENPAATIQISGYTDGLGSAQYNAKLSDKRARACADYLIKKGIEASRVTFVSFGACCPIEMELINGRDNPDGRSKNRRALINVKKN